MLEIERKICPNTGSPCDNEVICNYVARITSATVKHAIKNGKQPSEEGLTSNLWSLLHVRPKPKGLETHTDDGTCPKPTIVKDSDRGDGFLISTYDLGVTAAQILKAAYTNSNPEDN